MALRRRITGRGASLGRWTLGATVLVMSMTAATGVLGVSPAGASRANTPPVVTTEPANVVAGAGHSVDFRANVSGGPGLTVQWLVSTDGVTFVDVPATAFLGTLTQLRFKALAVDDGNRYEAVYTNPLGTATTTAATLTVSFRQCRAKRHLHAHINLRGCDRTDAHFSGADLENSRFTNADLSGAHLVEANLSGAVFTDALLTDAVFTDANLTGANLTGANLTGAVLGGVTWSDTTCPDGTNSDGDGHTCVDNL